MAPRGSLGRLRAKVGDTLRPGARRRGAPPVPRPSGEPTAATGGVVVSYRPEHDGDPDPGEVVWAWVAYEDDPSQGKDRPVLILGWDDRLLAGVPLSSKDHGGRRDAADWVPVGTGAWDARRRESFADAARLLRLEPAAVRREGSALDERRFRVVIERVAILHGWSS